MRSIIPNKLWIGNARDARDVSMVLSLEIRSVVDLADSEPPIQFPRDIAYCRLPLVDGAGNDPALLRLAVAATSEFVKANLPTLVSCSAGMSRSPAIVAAALAALEHSSPDDVLTRITAEGPHDIAPAFWAEVKRAISSEHDSSTNESRPKHKSIGKATTESSDAITIGFTQSRALVLYEYLRRCDDNQAHAFIDQAEQNVLWDLEIALQPLLDAVLNANYDELLEVARKELRDRE